MLMNQPKLNSYLFLESSWSNYTVNEGTSEVHAEEEGEVALTPLLRTGRTAFAASLLRPLERPVKDAVVDRYKRDYTLVGDS